MFERNKIDTTDHAIPVEILSEDGVVQKGRLLVAMGRNIYEVLNSPGAFLDFEPYGGERMFVAKSTLRNVTLLNVPRAPNLAARVRDLDGFDPHSILGVPSSATFDDVKAAWHKLSKAYHPDRYANAELPAEVNEYLSVMARRVNAAYATLETQMTAQKRVAVTRATPIYTSGARRG